MGIFDFLKAPDINQGIETYRATPGAVLLDVRTPQEYQTGHISGSQNFPLQMLRQSGASIGDLNTPVFIYCQSGARSRQALVILKQMGYHNCQNIGGICSYKGKVVN